MKRNQKSFLNAISAAFLTISNGLFGLILTSLILKRFGSDFNGLNATANQLVTLLMLLEGGFTIATNVALFKPFSNHDLHAVNGILVASRKRFKMIGLHAMWVSIVLSIGYSFFVNTKLSQIFVISLVFMTLFPAALNLYFSTAYRIVIQADQKEYIISVINLITLLTGYILNIFFIKSGFGMWIIRFITMIFSIINTFLICYYVKKKYPFINFKSEPDYSAIKGTKQVFIQKATGILYSSAPILALTMTSGTMLASVYAVYNSVFSLLKSALHSVIDAPRLSLGDLISQQKKDNTWRVFQEYQWIVLFMLYVLLTTASVLIMPFVNLYTKGIEDINYNQPIVAILLILITFFELLHLPSGHLINMSGNFKTAKNIQLISLLCLIILLLIGTLNFSIIGILSAVLLTSIILSTLEIVYVHIKYFENKIFSFLKLIAPFIVIAIIFIFLEISLLPTINNYFIFIVAGFVLTFINFLIGILISLVFNKENFINFVVRIKSFVKRSN